MDNPAKELAEKLAAWNVPRGGNAADARGASGSGGDLRFWREQARAVALLEEIGRAIDVLSEQNRDVTAIVESMPDWYRAVFSYGIPWNQGQQSAVAAISPSSLNILSSFALVLDLMGDTSNLSATQKTSLRELLTEARELLRGDLGGVSGAERAYVSALVEALDTALSYDGPLDAEQLKALLDQLTGALVGVATQLSAAGDVSTAQKVMRVVGGIAGVTRTLVYDAAAIAAIVTTVPVVQKMLGS